MHEQLLRELDQRLHSLLTDPTYTNGAGILSICLAIPPQPRIPSIDNCSDCLYWNRPSQQHYRIGSGRLTLTSTSGEGRFERLDQALKRLQSCWQVIDPDDTGSCNPVFCGFAFDADDNNDSLPAGIANSLLFIPEVLLEQRADNSRLIVSCRTGAGIDVALVIDNWLYRLRRLLSPPENTRPDSHNHSHLRPTPVVNDHHHWNKRVQQALAAIGNGQLHKVVLSRQLRIELPPRFQLQHTLAWLVPRYPQCTLFAVRHGGQTLLGVSPENLLSLEQRRLRVDAVGGTAERSTDPHRDLQLAETLAGTGKTLHEHRLVVQDIIQQLQPYCSGLVYPQQPDILKLPTVQHLHSRISGQTATDASVLQLAAHLHPTPATGGLPRKVALNWLRDHGEQQRGWYTGALGWLSAAGDGELAVILRCALLGQRQATLYAGAGIVAGSDPQQEFLETEWKLQTMISALQAGGSAAQPLSMVEPDSGQAT